MAAELGAGLRIFRDVSRRQPCRDTPASFASIWGWGFACLLLFSFPPFYLFIYLHFGDYKKNIWTACSSAPLL